jgi:hypothetical protein
MGLVATFTCFIGPEALQALRACASEASSIGPDVLLDCERPLRQAPMDRTAAARLPPLMVHAGRRPSIVRPPPIPRASLLAGYTK